MRKRSNLIIYQRITSVDSKEKKSIFKCSFFFFFLIICKILRQSYQSIAHCSLHAAAAGESTGCPWWQTADKRITGSVLVSVVEMCSSTWVHQQVHRYNSWSGSESTQACSNWCHLKAISMCPSVDHYWGISMKDTCLKYHLQVILHLLLNMSLNENTFLQHETL